MSLDVSNLSEEEMLELIELNAELELRKKRRKIDSVFVDDGPLRRELYKKHLAFFAAGAEYRQRLFCAANQVGKTTAALTEVVYHLTGQYPHWWVGKRFSIAQDWTLVGESWKDVKKVLQDKLLGKIKTFGQGLIPYEALDFDTMTKPENVNTLIQTFNVRHVSGGISTVFFGSYDAGRESFQGFKGNILLDEEPPLDVYSECLTRTTAKNDAGESFIVILTFTPLKGMSEVINNFMPQGFIKEGSPGPGKYVVNVQMEDVPHIDEQTRLELEASYHPHVRDARMRGIPSLGSGAIYPVPESDYVVKDFEIPANWKRAYGMDVGWKRTACIWFALNPSTNIWYGYSEYYEGQKEPILHAEAIKARGDWIPCVIDTASRASSQQDGKTLFDTYTNLGLKLNQANKAIDAGILNCWQLLTSGKIKIFGSLNNFLHEIRNYQRDESGKIKKENDHLMDAFRYFVMSGRDIATTQQPEQSRLINTPTYRPRF